MRFNLRELFAIIFVCAFGCVALVRSTPLLGSLFFSFTLCLLLVAILAAVATQRETRFFWLGFAIAGSAYLWVSRDPEPGMSNDDRLITTRILQAGYERIYPPGRMGGGRGMMSIGSTDDSSPAAPTPSANPSLIYGSGQHLQEFGDYDAFMLSGHCLFALLLAWIAGHFTRFVHARSRIAKPSGS